MIAAAVYLAGGVVGIFAVIGATLRLEDIADEVRDVIRAYCEARAGQHRAMPGHGAVRTDLGTLRVPR